MKRSILPYALALLFLPLTLPAGASILVEEDFSDPDSDLARQLLAHPKIALSEGGGVDGSNGIRVAYVGGDMGSERVVVRYPLPEKVTFARLSFDVFFEEDWQWVRAGKLHGVGPLQPVTGGRTKHPEGWSSRMMWRKDGGVVNYLYDQDETHKYGKGDRSDTSVLEKGKWHRIDFETTLNDPGEANGQARLYVDGQLVCEDDAVEFRGTGGEGTLIQQFLFSTFHGGNDPTWAPKDENGDYTTVHARFDNFEVNTVPLGE